jgi:hypothetical protein
MSAIKSPTLFVISIVIAVVALGMILDRVLFLAHARRTTGTVTHLYATNGSCSCGRRCHYSCTQFSAVVKFSASGSDTPSASTVVTAGTARQYNQPLTRAQYREWDSVPIVYDSRHGNRAYRDTVSDVWGAPFMALFFHLVTLMGSFSEHRRGWM